MPGWDDTGTAEKSYPSPRSRVAAERSYPTSEVRGGSWEELPPRPRPGAADRKSNPTCKERWLHGCRRA